MTQSQKAGAGSSQTQYLGDVHQTFQIGPTRDEMVVALREEGDRIMDTIRQEIVSTYVSEGVAVAGARIDKFDARLLDVLSDEGSLQALKDPAFQVLLKKAQIGAASSERDDDYDLLANLLGERTKDSDRRARASIAKAVEVVDSLDDPALQGITMLFFMWDLRPANGDIEKGIDGYSRDMENIGCDLLPMGRGWLDHIDILGLARIDQSGAQTLKPFEEKLARSVTGYTCKGVAEDGVLALEHRFESEAGVAFKLVPHTLKPGYFRLPFADAGSLESGLARAVLSEEQRERALSIAVSELGIDELDPDLIPRFAEFLDARPALAACRAWWNQIPYPPFRTSVGTAIGYSNASRFMDMSNIPPLHAYLTR